MSTISGKDGKIMIGATKIADITRWNFKTTADTTRYASSATNGYKKSVAGSKSGDGSIEFKLDMADPITDDFDEGDEVILLLHLDETRYYTVPATIKDIDIGVTIDGGEVIAGTANFESNGAWTKPTY